MATVASSRAHPERPASAILPRRAMPKMKTHSGAKKRFKTTATGKIKGRHAFTSHILEKKSPKRKRHLSHDAVISPDDVPRIRKLLGIGK